MVQDPMLAPMSKKIGSSSSLLLLIGMFVKDVPGQELRKDHFQVAVERLDSFFTAAPADNKGTVRAVQSQTNQHLSIPLVKLDIQGYECNALEGFGQAIASHIQTIKFEVAPEHLKAQHCNNLFGRLRNYGFYIRPVSPLGTSSNNNKQDTATVEYITDGEAFDFVVGNKNEDFLAVSNPDNKKSY